MRFEVGKYYRHIDRSTRIHVLGYLPQAVFDGDPKRNGQILVAETIYGQLRTVHQGRLTKWVEEPSWTISKGKAHPTKIVEDKDPINQN